jgi:hypothetical protein
LRQGAIVIILVSANVPEAAKDEIWEVEGNMGA